MAELLLLNQMFDLWMSVAESRMKEADFNRKKIDYIFFIGT